MTLSEFVAKYDGKAVDWDKAFGNQCVDLYRQYVHEVLNAPQSPAIPGAKDIWNNYLSQFFTRISNTPEGVPQPGDVIIWGTGLGQFGHVAIFISGGATRFTSFDQNYPVGSLCHKQTHGYTGVLGWLRFKGGSLTELQECLNLHKKLVDETIDLKKAIENLKAEREAINVDIDNMRKSHEEEVQLLNVQLQNLLSLETKLQTEIDGRRNDQLAWDMKRLDLEGEIAKLKQQIASEDLSLRDYKLLTEALVKKVLRYIESLKK